MRVKKVPVFYTPYLLWPAKSERTSGLLVPNIGYSNLRGSYVGLAYFQILGRSFDTTLFADSYGKGFVGVGDEFRYRPTEGTPASSAATPSASRTSDDWRWKMELDHTTNDLPWGMRGVVTLRRYSDFNFFRDFERSTSTASGCATSSRGGSSPATGDRTRSTSRSPSARPSSTTSPPPTGGCRSWTTACAPPSSARTPLVLKVDSSLAYLSVDRSATYRSDYGRIDLQPQLSLPFRPAPWLSLALSAGERFTWYGDSLDATGQAFTGDSLTRTVPGPAPRSSARRSRGSSAARGAPATSTSSSRGSPTPSRATSTTRRRSPPSTRSTAWARATSPASR